MALELKSTTIPVWSQLSEQVPGNLRAVLFDMDGTLVDSEPLHAQCLFETIHQVGKGQALNLSWHEIEAAYTGQSDPCVYQDLVEKDQIGSNWSLEKFLAKKNNFFEKKIQTTDKQALFWPHMASLFNAIKQQGLKIAVVSASERYTVELVLKHINLYEELDMIVAREDCQYIKPHPGPYLMAMKNLKIETTETLIIEDSKTGVQAARASGANLMIARWFTKE